MSAELRDNNVSILTVLWCIKYFKKLYESYLEILHDLFKFIFH